MLKCRLFLREKNDLNSYILHIVFYGHYNLSSMGRYTDLSDYAFDNCVLEIISASDEPGLEVVGAWLMGEGIIVQRWHMWLCHPDGIHKLIK